MHCCYSILGKSIIHFLSNLFSKIHREVFSDASTIMGITLPSEVIGFGAFKKCFTFLSWNFIWKKVFLLLPRLETSTRELRMRIEVFFFLSVFV
ncbi:hypothetical protein V6Z12_D02G099100 [Gossypium hirsutum]|uniref:Uncharacterized protein n=1 Tax=Gossypium tomentosum TaxID=34277 RepID=A0A5D2LVI3_GOSTO|nr:hypothetical protein ES332_D02G106800v1 [Gossypium tomentosum]